MEIKQQIKMAGLCWALGFWIVGVLACVYSIFTDQT